MICKIAEKIKTKISKEEDLDKFERINPENGAIMQIPNRNITNERMVEERSMTKLVNFGKNFLDRNASKKGTKTMIPKKIIICKTSKFIFVPTEYNNTNGRVIGVIKFVRTETIIPNFISPFRTSNIPGVAIADGVAEKSIAATL